MQRLKVNKSGTTQETPAVDALMLVAISHDLQTPITRMKLRVEQMDDSLDRDRLWNDLDEMQHLVRAGVAYARSMDGASEMPYRIDLAAFLDSLVCDYRDGGRDVTLVGTSELLLETRPHTLRRVLVNLIDNALKFAGSAQLTVERDASGSVRVQVLDRGPGIDEKELAKVFKPFYRLDRSISGTGLGLAIAQRLSQALCARLSLHNREGGGLRAQLELRTSA